MITRSNLAEQLRDYQIRSQHKSDAAKAGLWGLLFLVLLIFSSFFLYLKYTWLGFSFVCIAVLLPVCLKIIKQTRLAKNRQRRMLLPLSM